MGFNPRVASLLFSLGYGVFTYYWSMRHLRFPDGAFRYLYFFMILGLLLIWFSEERPFLWGGWALIFFQVVLFVILTYHFPLLHNN